MKYNELSIAVEPCMLLSKKTFVVLKGFYILATSRFQPELTIVPGFFTIEKEIPRNWEEGNHIEKLNC